MLISVANKAVGSELDQALSHELTLVDSLSMRRGGSPPVLISDNAIVYHHPDWTLAMAREFAKLRQHEEPADVEVPDGFLNSLPVRRLGSTRGPDRNRSR